MIITPERLLDLAREETERRARSNRVRCAFVTGSAVSGDPLLGGTADVDLVLIHRDHPLRERELVRLSQDVHLDLYQYAEGELDPPRDLRTDPVLGPAIASGVTVYDPEHRFDWLQAGVRAHFRRPDQRLARSAARLQRARSTRRALAQSGEGWPQVLARAAFQGANAAAALTREAAAGRRAILQVREALIAADRADLYADLIKLLGMDDSAAWDLPAWLSAWAKAYDSATQERSEPTLSEVRRDYYLRGFQALADDGETQAVIYGLISTWPLPQGEESEPPEAEQAAWLDLLGSIGLAGESPEAASRQLEGYLDQIELYLETWGAEHGA